VIRSLYFDVLRSLAGEPLEEIFGAKVYKSGMWLLSVKTVERGERK
jgi:hypothetical protein